MSRHASERLNGHESQRLASAIVGHLRALCEAMPAAPQVRNDSLYWLEQWEKITERQQVMQHNSAAQCTADVFTLPGEKS